MKSARLAARLPGIARSIARNRSGSPDRPRFLTYIVTFRCNARCVMCDSWRIPGQQELDLDEIGRVFDQLPRLDAVRLSGGEPFLRPDFTAIADLAVRKLRPLFLHVTSNGFSTDRIRRFVEERDRSVPLEMLLSIDGFDKKHDNVRGRSTAWKRVRATIDAIAPLRSSHEVRIAVNQVILDEEGLEHYRLLRDEFAELQIPVQPVLAYDESATYSVEREREDIEFAGSGHDHPFGPLSEAWIHRFLDEVEGDLRELPISNRAAKRFYTRSVRDRLDGKAARFRRCVALSSHLRLLPNGDVPTCQFNGKVVGNLRAQPFQDVWNSANAEEQRRWVRGCPGCLAECEIVPNAIYTGAILRDVLSS